MPSCSPGSASVQQALEWAETEAMLKQGFDVLPPFDRARGPDMDFFTEEGKSQWRVLAEEAPEHHAPDCKTMSRARGKPFKSGERATEDPPFSETSAASWAFQT